MPMQAPSHPMTLAVMESWNGFESPACWKKNLIGLKTSEKGEYVLKLIKTKTPVAACDATAPQQIKVRRRLPALNKSSSETPCASSFSSRMPLSISTNSSSSATLSTLEPRYQVME